MGVYVKDLKMPKNCGSCPFFEVVSCEEDSKDYRCARTGLYIFPKEKSIYCPLVEIKTPHGRLIDADAAMKAACESLCHLGVFCPDNLCKEVRETFDAVPTIIEADDSIKRAEWEKHNDGIMYWWECSKCHHDAWYDGDDLHNYCPWCGAKMTIIESEGEDGKD